MDSALPECLIEAIHDELRHVTLANPETKEASGPLREVSLPVAACTSLEGKVFQQSGVLVYQIRLTGEFSEDVREDVLSELRSALRVSEVDESESGTFESWSSVSSVNIRARVTPEVLFPEAEIREMELVTGEVVQLRIPPRMLEDAKVFVEEIWWKTLSDTEKRQYFRSGTLLKSEL